MTDLPDYAHTANLDELYELPSGTIISWADKSVRIAGVILSDARYEDPVLQLGDTTSDFSAIPVDSFPVWVVWTPPTDVDMDAELESLQNRRAELIEPQFDPRERGLELAIEVYHGEVDIDAIMAAAERFAEFLKGDTVKAASNG
jgi:hypothetical protein